MEIREAGRGRGFCPRGPVWMNVTNRLWLSRVAGGGLRISGVGGTGNQCLSQLPPLTPGDVGATGEPPVTSLPSLHVYPW